MPKPAILAIDPGSSESAWAQIAEDRTLYGFGKIPNDDLIACLTRGDFDARHLAVEYMKPRGMPTAKEEMDTQFWAGRFVQAWGEQWTPIYRMDVKVHLCGSARARDANIRQAIIDLYSPTGGGKCKQIGVSGNQGPLYGVSKDVWSALGIALTWLEKSRAAD
jgi:hypothetical protein